MTTAIQNHISGRLHSAGVGEGGNGPGAVYGMFNRHGGISRDNFGSLNIGYHVGDSPECVLENRQRVKARLGIPLLLSARQVHGTSLYCFRDALESDDEIGESSGYDAMVTDRRGVGLMIQHADCQGVLLYEPNKGVICAVHAGWRGSVQQILQKTVAVMVGEYGVRPERIQAIISPSLGPCCAEFVNYKKELPAHFSSFMVKENYFDFWSISKEQLVEAGLVAANIWATKICTACSNEYFSYRRACRQTGGVTGRNCSVIALE